MRVHFIGIGGIGVSSLAQYFLAKGHTVSGSDLVSSEITDFLKKKGAKIFIGRHKKENLKEGVGLVVFSPAIGEKNPELLEAKKRKILIQSYPQTLGNLTKKYFTIAVSGTHGKSTTTAMISLILSKAGLDPTVILGTKLKEFGDTNFRFGKSKYLIIEADEHFASFLNYWPKIIVLTSLEADHLDYYKNFNNYISAFKKFISHLPNNGYLIINGDDKNILKTKLAGKNSWEMINVL
jgi:UDP-N-acetylmuramate--alanine ligase